MYSLPMRQFALAGLLGLVLVGCGQKGDPLVGTWISDGDLGGAKLNAESTYNADGTYSGVVTMTLPGKAGKLTTTQAGKWKREGEKLKVTLESYDVKAADIPAAYKPMFDQQNTPESRKKMMDEANTQPATELKWTNDNEFTASIKGQTLTFKRKG